VPGPDTNQGEDMANPTRTIDDVIRVSFDRGIAQVQLNRPARRNALTMSLWEALGDTVDELSAQADVSVIVITGTGNSFCAGADISEFDTTRADAAQTLEYEHAYEGCCDRIASSGKPTIAAIDGFCMGGGCNLAMSCDFRIASASSTFAIPAARLSIVYGVAGTGRLLALVGLVNAKRILYMAEKLTAGRAKQIGLIDEIAEQPILAASELGERLKVCAPLSIAGSKAVLEGLVSGLGSLSSERVVELMSRAANSNDYKEGRQAFLEKRAPNFTGA
jgi:enoyl-CoA hydratase/carnithine racemase